MPKRMIAYGVDNTICESDETGELWTGLSDSQGPFGAGVNPAGIIRTFVWAPELNKGLFAGSWGPSGGDESRAAIAERHEAGWMYSSWSYSTPPFTDYARCGAWSPELGLFALGAESGGQIATSPDGVNWTLRSSPLSYHLRAMEWVAPWGLFVVVGGFNTSGVRPAEIATSPDGITWTKRTITGVPLTFLYHLWCLSWSPELGRIVAGASSGRFATSTDGIAWARVDTPNMNLVSSAAWSPTLGKYLATTSDNTLESSDGLTWTQRGVAAERADMLWWAPNSRWYGVSPVRYTQDSPLSWDLAPTDTSGRSFTGIGTFDHGVMPEPEPVTFGWQVGSIW